MQIPTIKIEGEKGGYVIINEDDFDPKKHKKFTDKKPVKKEK